MDLEQHNLIFEMQGDDAHNGNVIADAFVRKLNALLTTLARMERLHTGRRRKDTLFTIVNAGKINPTFAELRPQPTRHGYDPTPALMWTVQQFEVIAGGGDADPEVDAATADGFVDLSRQIFPDLPQKTRLKYNGRAVSLNEEFHGFAAALAEKRRKHARETTQWYEGTSKGVVRGELRQIGDIEGDLVTIVVPSVGPNRIECVLSEAWRERVKHYLWKNVEVEALLHYRADSPFPFSADVLDIREVETTTRRHLIELEGLLEDFPRPSRTDFGAFLG